MKKYILALITIIILQSCSCSNESYVKNPVDVLITQMDGVKPYSIILYDMDVDGSFSHTYKHRYKVVTEDVDSIPKSMITGWKKVPEAYFRANENNLGMEIVSKNSNGKLSKNAAPAGYGNYVGNSRYGQWQTNNRGESFWSFYGKYMMLSSVFNMIGRPSYRNDYSHYRSGGYYGNRSYYGSKGSDGSYRYGTNSKYTKTARPDFFQRKASKRGWSKSSSRSSSSSSTSRSRTSSSRSRSGGFGK
ncbi:MAG: hypothetical protein KAG96_08045 [Ichthyobacteriaceae bacterium]|nr:hypothetical protein [Ichthyobacteriaceae bacterium]